MGLFLKQTEQRSQLQSKVAADLAERLNKRALDPSDTKPKPQPAILDNQRQTSALGWVWLVLAVLAIAGVVYVLLPK
jgi:hypothetical protein